MSVNIDNYIILTDPWGVVTDQDSGFGNRLQCWQAAIILRKHLGDKHEIICPITDYPELVFIDMPNTMVVKDIEQFVENTLEIQDKHIGYFLSNDTLNLDNSKNYNLKFNFANTINILDKFLLDDIKTITSDIKLKNTSLNNALEKFCSDKIGFHIRRGNGVYINDKCLNEIPFTYRKFYTVCKGCDKQYKFIKDQTFFNIFNRFLEKNIDTKFFISIDVEEQALDYYRTMYPGKIFTCSDFIKHNTKVIQDSQILKEVVSLKLVGYNLIDFFSLIKCRYILRDTTSSWSGLASIITKSCATPINFSLDDIIRRYELKRYNQI